MSLIVILVVCFSIRSSRVIKNWLPGCTMSQVFLKEHHAEMFVDPLLKSSPFLTHKKKQHHHTVAEVMVFTQGTWLFRSAHDTLSAASDFSINADGTVCQLHTFWNVSSLLCKRWSGCAAR